jgi:hypothetical protein
VKTLSGREFFKLLFELDIGEMIRLTNIVRCPFFEKAVWKSQ